jgi:hypothetical protein
MVRTRHTSVDHLNCWVTTLLNGGMLQPVLVLAFQSCMDQPVPDLGWALG